MQQSKVLYLRVALAIHTRVSRIAEITGASQRLVCEAIIADALGLDHGMKTSVREAIEKSKPGKAGRK